MRILIVEDDPRLANLVARGLREQTYAVDVCGDGREAMVQAVVNEYDAIILDVMLPGKDGLTVIRELRARNVRTPVLMLTARDAIADRIAGLDGGADDYLTKPFSLDELEARIKALLRRPKSTISESLKVGDLELNLTERTVYKNDERVNLTLKEFALLEYFMRNKDRVISRDELLSHVWDFNYTSFFSNSVDVHIKNLRKKIKDDTGQRMIETVRGVGYRLSEPMPLGKRLATMSQ